jgi:hypothetical protein
MGRIRGLTIVFVLVGLTVCVACSSDRSAGHGDSNRSADTPQHPEQEAASVQAYLDSRYKHSDVRHSFRNRFGEGMVDCVDFFATSEVKDLAKHGTPLTEIPTPPPFPANRRATPQTFEDVGTDEDGNRRTCPAGSVPFQRLTAETIESRGGLNAFVSSRATKARSADQTRPTAPGRDPSPIVLQGTQALAPPLAPPPPSNGGTCGQFPQGDLSSAATGAYAHVQQTVYPGASGPEYNIAQAWTTMSIYDPYVPVDKSHSLMQVWLYSGWGFNNFGCTCGTPGVPCTESVEVGWDVDPFFFSATPELFVASTNNGYTDFCQNDCAHWQPLPGAGMSAGMPLPYSVPGYLPQYELGITVVAGGSGSTAGWYVMTDLAALNGGTGGIAPSWIGYFPFATQFTGLMAEGQAQEFQVGGEVDDFYKGTHLSAPWTQIMGSSQAPTTGYGNSAYVYNTEACNGVGVCTEPTTVGPATVPDSYSYALTNGPDGFTLPSGWHNYFFLGDVSTRAYSWSEVTIGSGAPTLLAPYRGPGYVFTTMAPVYVPSSGINEYEFRMYAVSNTQVSYNYLIEEFSSLSAGWAGSWVGLQNNLGAALYLGAVTADYNNGAFWGWDSDGNVWTNDGPSEITEEYSTFWDVAVWNSGSVYGGEPGGGGLGPPYGDLNIASKNTSGVWTNAGISGDQFAFDPIAWEYDSNPYVLDEHSVVWEPTEGGYVALTAHICGGSASLTTLTQIAVKAGVVFGLGQAGTVWAFYGGCWSQVGKKTEFANSIATDNGYTTAVWASDSSGKIWTAE